MKSMIVAYDKNRGIGADNDLLWLRDLPADLQRFKETTMGGVIIMGSKTYASIGRPLPGRQNVVVSRRPLEIEGVTVAHSIEEAYDSVESGREIFVIGGAQIYELALPTVDRILATEVDASFPQATVFFPVIGTDWQETSREHHEADERNKYAFDFVTFIRR